MFDVFAYYGIPAGLVAGAGLVLAAVIVRFSGRGMPRFGGFMPPSSESVEDEDEDDVGGSFTCFFCDISYDVGAKDCICYGCNRYVCLACTYYEEDQTPGGPEGPHTASDHPAYEKHVR